ncbi:MAG: methyltransferase domain-containing protein [Coriobacteriia bacterium]|nr:methyltransferase domain-containing protein [Coriobacteriia bacterium]
MSLAPGRSIALAALRKSRARDAWIRETVEAQSASAEATGPDAAFARRLAIGVTATRGTLDQAIDSHVPRPRDVAPAVRDALRLGAFEMLFENAEPRVAVHQGVEAVKAVQEQAAGFANAVLRRIAEDAEAFPWGDPDSDVAALARATGHPEWLAGLLVEQYGHDAARTILDANNTAAPLYVAHNPFRGTRDALVEALLQDGAEPADCDVPGCLVCRKPARAVRGRALAEGLAVVSDAAAQLVARIASLSPEGDYLDVGAGRGTKTMLIQAALNGHATVLAIDIHEFKIEVLSERMEHLGVPGVSGLVCDALDAEAMRSALPHGADVVLIDAPCSNVGTLRRHPEKRWALVPEDCSRLAELGLRLLTTACGLVRTGGFVVYSTCTILRRENEDVVESFLSSEQGSPFVPYGADDRVPGSWARFITDEGWFCSLPEAGGPDGHFAAVLARR